VGTDRSARTRPRPRRCPPSADHARPGPARIRRGSFQRRRTKGRRRRLDLADHPPRRSSVCSPLIDGHGVEAAAARTEAADRPRTSTTRSVPPRPRPTGLGPDRTWAHRRRDRGTTCRTNPRQGPVTRRQGTASVPFVPGRTFGWKVRSSGP
jgi:hypothetical protein